MHAMVCHSSENTFAVNLFELQLEMELKQIMHNL